MPTTTDLALRARLARVFLRHREDVGLGSDEQVMIALDALSALYISQARAALLAKDLAERRRLAWFLAAINGEREQLDG